MRFSSLLINLLSFLLLVRLKDFLPITFKRTFLAWIISNILWQKNLNNIPYRNLLLNCRRSCSQMFYKIGVLKNFADSKQNTCVGVFSNIVADLWWLLLELQTTLQNNKRTCFNKLCLFNRVTLQGYG